MLTYAGVLKRVYRFDGARAGAFASVAHVAEVHTLSTF
jgi:hypothetical protein